MAVLDFDNTERVRSSGLESDPNVLSPPDPTPDGEGGIEGVGLYLRGVVGHMAKVADAGDRAVDVDGLSQDSGPRATDRRTMRSGSGLKTPAFRQLSNRSRSLLPGRRSEPQGGSRRAQSEQSDTSRCNPNR